MNLNSKSLFLSFSLCVLMFMQCPFLSGRPARGGRVTFTQPDGSTFTAIVTGDEWFRIKTTASGEAIKQESDGWWHYASYSADGTKTSTGYKVGKSTPQSVLDRCRFIPRERLRERARARRESLSRAKHEENILQRIRRSRNPMSVSESPDNHKYGIVILAEFPDVPFKYTMTDFRNMLTKSMYNGIGCAKEYFDAQFKGMYEFTFDVSPIVKLSRKRSHYGANNSHDEDNAPAEMVREACELAAKAGVDFSPYDQDGDGYVDNVYVFYSGEDESDSEIEDCIWAHQWYIGEEGAGLPELEVNGKIISRYACSGELVNGTELTGIGTFCHEYSHTFDLPDLYDTDYDENGESAALWFSTALMDGGSYNNDGHTPPYFNAIEREILGLGAALPIEVGKSYSMEPIHLNNVYYRWETGTPDEYYLLECRSNDGWDEFIGGKGMLVYHIDKTDMRKWELDNTVNAVLSHQCADLIEADPNKSDDMSDRGTSFSSNHKLFFPYENLDITALMSTTHPTFRKWDGTECEIAFAAIEWDSDNIRFNTVSRTEISDTPPSVADLSRTVFQDAVIIRFSSDMNHGGKATVRYGKTGSSEMEEMTVEPNETGRYAVLIEGLSPRTSYSVRISFKANGQIGNTETVNFMTNAVPANAIPYISFKDVARNEDGSFPRDSRIPLRVSNATKAVEIEWTFNDEPVSIGKDCSYKVEQSGTLRAEILWKDGSSDIIEKIINIR